MRLSQLTVLTLVGFDQTNKGSADVECDATALPGMLDAHFGDTAATENDLAYYAVTDTGRIAFGINDGAPNVGDNVNIKAQGTPIRRTDTFEDAGLIIAVVPTKLLANPITQQVTLQAIDGLAHHVLAKDGKLRNKSNLAPIVGRNDKMTVIVETTDKSFKVTAPFNGEELTGFTRWSDDEILVANTDNDLGIAKVSDMTSDTVDYAPFTIYKKSGEPLQIDDQSIVGFSKTSFKVTSSGDKPQTFELLAVNLGDHTALVVKIDRDTNSGRVIGTYPKWIIDGNEATIRFLDDKGSSTDLGCINLREVLAAAV